MSEQVPEHPVFICDATIAIRAASEREALNEIAYRLGAVGPNRNTSCELRFPRTMVPSTPLFSAIQRDAETRAMLAEEEKRAVGDSTRVENIALAPGEAVASPPVAEKCERCGFEHEPGYTCGPVAEPKRRVEEVLNELYDAAMQSAHDIMEFRPKIEGVSPYLDPIKVIKVTKEALRLYREERTSNELSEGASEFSASLCHCGENPATHCSQCVARYIHGDICPQCGAEIAKHFCEAEAELAALKERVERARGSILEELKLPQPDEVVVNFLRIIVRILEGQ